MNAKPEQPVEGQPSEDMTQDPSEQIQFAEVDSGENDSAPDLQTQLAEAEKRCLIAQADLENYRKRAQRDFQERLKYAPLKLMTEILEISDNLNRAIESAEKDADATQLVEGVQLVAKQIDTALEGHGCRKIESVGQPFDPNFHEAVQMQPSDEYEPNTVMLEVRSGFRLYDRVVRPAQVFVSTGKAAK